MKVLDLSLRYKLPIWGGILILITAFTVTGSLLHQSYKELHEDLQINVKVLGNSLLFSLYPALILDDYSRVKSIIAEPLKNLPSAELTFVKDLLIIDPDFRIYASALLQNGQNQIPLARVSNEYMQISLMLRQIKSSETQVVSLPESQHIYFLFPIISGSNNLGTLIIVSDTRGVLPRFYSIAFYGLLAGGLILAILLPINWYWGQHMTIPLMKLTERMESLGSHAIPDDLDGQLYVHQDELGKLFQAYNKMVQELNAKAEMENQMVKAERLAALGQLAAGVAHEINNPLGGMLTAIDTLKCHSSIDPRTLKTITLIERGLGQIKDTVSALLVEGRLKNRPLAWQDIEDVRTLIMPQLSQNQINLEWNNSIKEEIELPSTLIRQVMINLLLNAIAAVDPKGTVTLHIWHETNQLQLQVSNGGKMLTDEQMSHLFEPFSTLSENGHGLGLWVTYQIVHQLKGHVWAVMENKQIVFNVILPVGALN